MKRENGYYWVEHDHFSWVVAYYRIDGKWSFEGEFFLDEQWVAIDERKIERL